VRSSTHTYRPAAVLTRGEEREERKKERERGGEREREREKEREEEDVDRPRVERGERASGGGEGVRKRKITEGRRGREQAGW